MAESLTPQALHKLIIAANSAKAKAYAPYSNFQVGAALLTNDGKIIEGCNVENASYGAGICAERTAMTRAVVEGHRQIKAVAVASNLPTPISPCGICRQFLREFLPLDTPIYMTSAAYPAGEGSTPPDDMNIEFGLPSVAKNGQGQEEEDKAWVRCLTMGELLPVSFGPAQLGR